MNDQELRAIVRQAIRKHLGGESPRPDAALRPAPALGASAPVDHAVACSDHASHALYITLESGGSACLIEPNVPCSHCGYCQSHGH